MNCDWAEKISLLIDGELPSEEARATESHLDTCAGCRRTKEDFLYLREAVSSYPLAADAAARRHALEKILASGAQSTRAAAAVALTTATPSQSWRELLRLPRLTPAFASALALLVVAVALGVVWSVGRRESGQKLTAEGTRHDGAQQVAQQQAAQQQTTQVPTASAPAPTSASNAQSSNTPSEVAVEKTIRDDNEGVGPGRSVTAARRANVRRAEAVASHRRLATSSEAGARVESAALITAARNESAEDALAEFKPLFAEARGPAGDEPERPVGETVGGTQRGETARHMEQAQILLRSVRNARAGDRPSAIADERRRSQKLLYRNIVLRREAALSGDAPVERALDSLEPLLIDIANLPDRASREDVTVIQERMRRKNIVAVLQANLAAVPRTY
jgi:hypothetical protein